MFGGELSEPSPSNSRGVQLLGRGGEKLLRDPRALNPHLRSQKRRLWSMEGRNKKSRNSSGQSVANADANLVPCTLVRMPAITPMPAVTETEHHKARKPSWAGPEDASLEARGRDLSATT